MGLVSTLSSEELAQLDIMIQLGCSTLQMSRRITRSQCCVRNYARDTMAHGSAKLTRRPRILNDRNKRSVKGIVPFFNRGNRKQTHTFQQDNAAIHKSSSTMYWFSTKKIKVLALPAYSPDLNPIENVWGLLARAVYHHGKQFQTVGELNDAVADEWDKLQSSYLESLTQSMSNRLCQVMQKFGGPTSY
uniref:Tc1-like transposase DDE domain-containing protein n=1 Tax=Caenorhabditis japonica TaxID=281687 RepID=A0A8R1HUF4_CAEJA